MKIVEVGTSTASQKAFLQFPVRLYRNDMYWIRPLDKDVNDVFDPGINKRFENGECIRYLLVDDANVTIGRVAVYELQNGDS